MATAVFFHAHPDDEAIASGGTIARAARDGHRVVIVLATRGELGEPVPGVLRSGEELWERRVEEAYVAARILGVDRVEFLGYRDSGMIGDASNDHERSFWKADIDAAAHQLAAILAEEAADLLCVYDDHGGYGHPDHIQVHRVGLAAAKTARVGRVFEMTMNRDQMKKQFARGEFGGDDDPPTPDIDMDSFGSPESMITHAIDVREFVGVKRAAMAAHASQIPADSFFLQMPDHIFADAFGTEWFIEHGQVRGDRPFLDDLFGP